MNSSCELAIIGLTNVNKQLLIAKKDYFYVHLISVVQKLLSPFRLCSNGKILGMIQLYGDIFEKVVLQQPLPFCHLQDFSVFPPKASLEVTFSRMEILGYFLL